MIKCHVYATFLGKGFKLPAQAHKRSIFKNQTDTEATRRRRIFQADDRGQFYSDCGQNDYLKQINGLQRCRWRTVKYISWVCSLANNHQNYYHFHHCHCRKYPPSPFTTANHNKCGIFSLPLDSNRIIMPLKTTPVKGQLLCTIKEQRALWDMKIQSFSAWM